MDGQELADFLERQREMRRMIAPAQKTASPPPDLAPRPAASPRRAEGFHHRSTKLDSPSQPDEITSSSAPTPLIPVRFYCWKDGKAGKITLGAVSDFTPD